MLEFTVLLTQAGTRTIIRLPDEISSQFPSRGMNMVSGTVNDVALTLPVEPDGKGGHWLEIPAEWLKDLEVAAGNPVAVKLDIITEWPEPVLPEDLMLASADGGLDSVWQDLTTRARWEWLRWIRSTKSAATRARRIEIALSKLSAGDRRPCCFNAASCTVPDVAKSGVLID